MLSITTTLIPRPSSLLACLLALNRCPPPLPPPLPPPPPPPCQLTTPVRLPPPQSVSTPSPPPPPCLLYTSDAADDM
eukprot:2576715-Rhodomonas_salina.1